MVLIVLNGWGLKVNKRMLLCDVWKLDKIHTSLLRHKIELVHGHAHS